MATKTSGKSSSHRTQGRKGSSAGRKSSTSSHARSGAQSNGKHRAQAKSHPGTQRTAEKSGGASKKRESIPRQAKSGSKAAGSKVKEMGSKLNSSVKQHPIASVALGAGAGLLLVEGVRRAIGAMGDSRSSQANDRDRDEDQDSGAEGSYEGRSESEEDTDEENAGDEDDESDPESRGREDESEGARNLSPRGIKGAAREGFGKGFEAAQRGWQEYPLAWCAAALGIGVVTGMLLPSSSVEDQMMGGVSDRVAGRIKNAGKAIREMAEKAYEEGVETAKEEAEHAGLTPDQLGRKVKRLVAKVRDAVSDAVQG